MAVAGGTLIVLFIAKAHRWRQTAPGVPALLRGDIRSGALEICELPSRSLCPEAFGAATAACQGVAESRVDSIRRMGLPTDLYRSGTRAAPAGIGETQSEVLVASEALPPGPETPVSIPAYFTGRPVQSVAYDGARELQITFQGAAGPAPWSQQPSVFSSARELGFNTALVDWFQPNLPYPERSYLVRVVGIRSNSTVWGVPSRNR